MIFSSMHSKSGSTCMISSVDFGEKQVPTEIFALESEKMCPSPLKTSVGDVNHSWVLNVFVRNGIKQFSKTETTALYKERYRTKNQ